MKTILLVEDEEDLRDIFVVLLESIGFNVIPAVDGIDALRCIEEHVPDIILSDNKMPNMDGSMLVKHIRAHTKTKHVPFVLISGFPPTDRDGYDEILNKPVNFERLRNVIHRLI